jgi:glycosyltransferase involved in cell wall biosynthesis
MLGPVDPSLVLDDGEVESIVERLNSLLRDRGRLEELGTRARTYAESFGWPTVVEKLEQVFAEAIRSAV